MSECSQSIAVPQSTYEFLEDFVERITDSEKEAGLVTMQLEEGPATGEIFDRLSDAHKRGLQIKIRTDPYALRMTRVRNRDVPNTLPILKRERRAERLTQHQATLERVRKLGELGILDIPPANASSGLLKRFAANHIKLAYTDDAAWIGTMNFTDSDIYEPGWRGDPQDYSEKYDGRNFIGMSNSMVRLNDPALVARVKRIAGVANPGHIDDEHEMPRDYELLHDTGERGESSIYDRAIEMVARAEEQIWFLGQYAPDGPLLDKLLRRASDGVDVYVTLQATGDHRVRVLPYNLAFSSFKYKTRKAPDTFMVEHQISPSHNKALIIDTNEALYGSHNLFHFLVKNVGVEELSLWSSDRDFADSVQTMLFMSDLLGSI